MASLSVDTRGKTAFRPGETVSGTVSWTVVSAPTSAELRLLWYTAGKGTVDVMVVDRVLLSTPHRSDSRDFSFVLPLGPYSFSGKLISLVWALELVVEPGSESARVDLTISPTGAEVLLGSAPSSTTPYEGA